MQLNFHQIDAFTQRPFSGNPAMVYRLDTWLDEAQMQRIAAEHNLAETAFVVKEDARWRIRWFTPTSEVPLCGHATLACACVLFEHYQEPGERLEFVCQSGALSVSREDGRLVLDFPCLPPRPIEVSAAILQALGGQPEQVLDTGKELMVVLADEQHVRACRPDLKQVAALPWLGMIVTAPGVKHDFVSRYFAPAIGIDEDPVTGSTHCSLIPYWAARLAKKHLTGFQCSARGGELYCSLEGDRVRIAGHAVRIASGTLWLD
ncbi:PhzF family phenazine biosynthesis protein [Pseudomonas sp. LS44]|uniref:PhzF family phenazine biosynthesis protein n=1 Tax=Pseudomonas sp. LS44 TaxID=1357074 RepID=UPI00215A7B73|nr:PhzF family phenazine biosynthesis protein [Pseudomonas sp. LS44]UVE18818.1 PhzF family phenazine biosynthesis protein [Pseudomonas sp. LS44]